VCEGQGDDVWWRSVSARGGPEWSWGVAVRLTPVVAGCASAATVPPCRAVWHQHTALPRPASLPAATARAGRARTPARSTREEAEAGAASRAAARAGLRGGHTRGRTHNQPSVEKPLWHSARRRPNSPRRSARALHTRQYPSHMPAISACICGVDQCVGCGRPCVGSPRSSNSTRNVYSRSTIASINGCMSSSLIRPNRFHAISP
jgi:hypothetical protein